MKEEITWSDFLGIDVVANQNQKYISYENAKVLVHKLNIKHQTDWAKYCKKHNPPRNVPATPNVIYKNNGWISWQDFLDSDYVAPFQQEFLSFENARIFARHLNFKSRKEWQKYCNEDKRPKNIPAQPHECYSRTNEWISWGDFLGTNNVHSKEFVSFEEAISFVRHLNLKNIEEWKTYCKSDEKPCSIPTKPERIYKNEGWTSWGDFLGTGRVSNKNMKYRPFEEAREFAISLGLINSKEWREYCSGSDKPKDIPSCPDSVYKNRGWKGMSDFLGIDNKQFSKKEFLSFKEARKFVRSLSLKGQKEWWEYSKNKLENIPSCPHRIYKNKGWKGYKDFLGNA